MLFTDRHLRALKLLILCGMGTHPFCLRPVAAQSPAPSSTTPSEAIPSAESAQDAPSQSVPVEASDLTSLNRILPVGKSAYRVTVPTVDEDGRLTSVVSMASVTRIDGENFRMEKVVLTSFDHADAGLADETAAKIPPEETVIRLVEATYHAPTRVLISDKPVTVSKPTLFLSGNSLHYDSAAGRAVMKGMTRAVITDLPQAEPTDQNSDPDPEPDEPGATDGTGSPAAPLPSTNPPATPQRQ